MGNKKRHNKNGGFTLVEVLVACAILGIALAPILSSFVAVARVNTTSRKKLSATTVAESVIESVKAFELKEFSYQCDQLKTGNASAFKLLAGDLEKGTGFSGGAAELKKNSDGSYTIVSVPSAKLEGGKIVFTPSGTAGTYGYRCYAFLITDIPMGGTTYDAVIDYTYVAEKSETTFTDESGTEQNVNSILQGMQIRSLKYYEVTVRVWKSESGTDSQRLAEYQDKSPLCTLEGTKADYN